MSLDPSLDPEQARVAIAEAEQRTSERQIHQMRLLIVLQSQLVTATAIAQIGTNRILDCTTPEGNCLHNLQSQSGGAIGALNQAAAQGRQDLLRKLGELARALGAPQSVVDHVLSEPEPTPAPFVVPPPPSH